MNPATGADDCDDPLTRVMSEFLTALEAGARPDRAAYVAAHPDLAPALVGLLAEVEALHDAGRRLGTDAAAVSAAPPLNRHTRLGDFEILRVLGRGGMGVVYEAVQHALGRAVALKVLPAELAISSGLRRRFLHEARVAALLSHPHIVPVYAVGEADDVPYYAMQLVDGQPLDAVLRVLREWAGIPAPEPVEVSAHATVIASGLAYGFPVPGTHQAGPASRARSGSVLGCSEYVHRVVRLATDGAGALAYVHETGVAHRDVKPGNLLLDVRGKVWLADFGLAKLLDGGNASTGRMGTLRYTSPEQLAGTAADPRTDVYALGLTLYELLTLRPAFPGAADTDLIRQIALTDPIGVRVLNPAVPIDLETVVHKAITKEPRDRYAGPGELAADLGRFAAGLPVRARRLTRLQRLRRWARRRRRHLSAFGATAAFGLILGLGLSTYFVWDAYRRAEAQRARVEAREAELLALVEQVNRSELVLKELPGAQAEQRTLVLRVKEVLCRLAEEPDAPERVRWAAYQVCRRVVDVESRFGNYAGLLEAAHEARNRLTELTGAAPRASEHRLERARCERDLGVAYATVGDQVLALGHYRASLVLFDELDGEEPGRPAVLRDLGHVRFSIAEILARRGGTDAGVALGLKGLAVDQALEGRYPDSPQSHIRLVISHTRLGWLYCRAGDPQRAEEQYRRAVEREMTLVRRFANHDTLRHYTVAARGQYGMFLAGRGLYGQAKKELDTCAADARRLGELYPQDVGYRVVQIDCHRELGRVAFLEGQIDDARRQFGLMVAVSRQLPADGVASNAAFNFAGTPVPGLFDPQALVAAVSDRMRANPSCPDFTFWLGVARMRAGEYAAAEDLLSETIDRGAGGAIEVAAARYYLACTRAKRGDRNGALAAFQAAEQMEWHRFSSDAAVRTARREAELVLGMR